MPATTVLFDARTAQLSLMGPVMLIFFGMIGPFAFRTLYKPRLVRGGELTVNIAAGVLILVATAAALASTSLPFFLGLRAKAAFSNGEVTITQGCVREFNREIRQNEHNVADTYFFVSERPFHFNTSPWLPGFHDEGDLIRPGDGLRITTTGNTVLRIERATHACRASG